MVTPKKNDAFDIAERSIQMIDSYEHRVYRIANSWDKSDIFYVESFTDENLDTIIKFLSKFSFEKFEDLSQEERKKTFESLIKILINLTCDCYDLMKKCIKLMRKKLKS